MNFFKNLFSKGSSRQNKDKENKKRKNKKSQPSYLLYELIKNEEALVVFRDNEFLCKMTNKRDTYRLDNTFVSGEKLISTIVCELDLVMLLRLNYETPNWYQSNDFLDLSDEKIFLTNLSNHYADFLDNTFTDEMVRLLHSESEGPEFFKSAKIALIEIMEELFFDSLVLLEAEMIANNTKRLVEEPLDTPDVDKLLSCYRSSEFKTKLIEINETMRSEGRL